MTSRARAWPNSSKAAVAASTTSARAARTARSIGSLTTEASRQGAGAAATAAFEEFGHARALEVTESFFWTFCDDYIELVKDRANDFDGSHDAAAVRSARATLAIAVDTFVRLLAPFLPFATEEVWSWYRTGSVHRAAWPQSEELREASAGADAELVARAGVALAALRKVKSEAKTSQKTPILSVTLAVAADRPEYAEAIEAVRADLTEAAKVTGPFTVEQAAPAADSTEGTSPVSVTAAELGEAPAKKK